MARPPAPSALSRRTFLGGLTATLATTQVAWAEPSTEPKPPATEPTSPVDGEPEPPAAPPDDTPPDVMDAGHTQRDLPAGRKTLHVRLPAASFATIAILGPKAALLGIDIVGGPLAKRLRARSPLDEDGLLPRTLSVRTGDLEEELDLTVDVADSVQVMLALATDADDVEPSAKGLKNGTELARPLIGFPTPSTDADGYQLASSARYVFARIDVVRSLRTAFAKTRKRFKLDPLFLSDASQWNGKRPKTDLAQPHHISHDGGCDVDIGFPANDTFPSTPRDHCRGVLLEPDRFGCSPGTAKGIDFDRLAYFLGILCDEAPGRITKIFIDDVYRREVIRVAPTLYERQWIKEGALVALGEDGVLVASPWHTDHFHVRFAGEKARPLLAT
ncbi:MAG: hypothetical protein U0271_27830 [Polyangiaceae bacterium]